MRQSDGQIFAERLESEYERQQDGVRQQWNEKKRAGQPCSAVLLGNRNTKRTNYLCQAAEEAGLRIITADWQECLEDNFFSRLQGRANILKIDPPVWDSFRLEELGSLTENYKNNLERLACLGDTEKPEIEFFNHPRAIAQLLDKRACKARLMQAGLPVTEEICADTCADLHTMRKNSSTKMHAGSRITTAENLSERVHAGSRITTAENLSERVHAGSRITTAENLLERVHAGSRITTAENLLERMHACRMYQVFIKPVNGSGAAGVSAFRWQPASGRMMLYTCALIQPGEGLVNTKRLRCLKEPDEVLALLGRILQMDCIVERWYAKAEYHGYSYDLRAVMQEGSLDFLLARLSKGPITNLHLNNHPLECSRLGLSISVLDHIRHLCQKAMECFPGLRSAGIDILLEKGNCNPRIIEMNAQGDLIYQDIFHENRIYRHQAEIMRDFLQQHGG